ncbi:MAG: hypothetical protein R2764_16965 [Bacteroidales bacterium]
MFGITGVVYLINGNNIIGILLIAAGASNVIWLLASSQPKNLFFVVLNFLFAGVSLIVAIDLLLYYDKIIALLFFAITLYYLISGFIMLMQIRKK